MSLIIDEGTAWRSLGFGTSQSTSYMNMSDTNFGNFDRDKFTIAVFGKMAYTADGGFPRFWMSQWHSSSNSERSWRLGISRRTEGTIDPLLPTWTDLPIKIQFQVRTATSTGSLFTSTTIPNNSFELIVAQFDGQNATANDRMKVFIGSSEASYSTRVNPAQESANNSTQDILVGATDSNSPTGHIYGQAYHLSFFSGVLVNPAELMHDIDTPLNITDISSLHSYLHVSEGFAVRDWTLSTNWTNNNNVGPNKNCPQQT